MRKLFAIALFASAAWATYAWAQQGQPAHTIPIAPGRGSTGWIPGGPCTAGQGLIWVSGTTVDPTCATPSAGSVTVGGTNILNNIASGILYGDSSNILQEVSPVSGAVLGYPNGQPTATTTIPAATQANITQVGVLNGGSFSAGFTLNFASPTLAGVVPGANGGTGVANTNKTITLGSSITLSGTGGWTFALPNTVATFTYPPATDILAGLSTVQSWTNVQTFASAVVLNGALSGTGLQTLFASPYTIGTTTPNAAVFSSATLINPLALTSGGTGQSSALLARTANGLNIDQLSIPGNVNFTIPSTTRTVSHTGVNHPLVDTLPSANSVNPGQELAILDQYGVFVSPNTLTVAAAGADTVNGVGSVVAISTAFGGARFKSDGVSTWSFVPASTGSGGGSGTVTQVACAKGTVCSTITTTGTVTAPAALLFAASASGSL